MKNPILILAVILGMAAGSGGTLFIAKMIKPKIEIPACPQCPACPPATEVKLQDFDVEKINNRKGSFTYSPQLHNVTIRIEQKDSVLLKSLLRKAK